MKYECYRCRKFKEETTGVMLLSLSVQLGGSSSHVFVCKDCLNPKEREKLKNGG